MRARVLKAFPYSEDGFKVATLHPGAGPIDIRDDLAPGLLDAGLITAAPDEQSLRAAEAAKAAAEAEAEAKRLAEEAAKKAAEDEAARKAEEDAVAQQGAEAAKAKGGKAKP